MRMPVRLSKSCQLITILAVSAALWPDLAAAQSSAPPQVASVPVPQAVQPTAAAPAANGDQYGIGEKYKVEFSYTFWQPNLDGSVSSDQLGLIGSRVDLTSDLSLERARFDDFRFVIRPAKKHRIKVEYTPVAFTGTGVLSREITFAGKVYPISLPVDSTLNWKVLRVGYEYDFFYRPRGFVGVQVASGYTNLTASIDSIIGSAETVGHWPLLEIGAAGRFYPIRHLAVNVEASGLQLTNVVEPDSLLKTMNWDLSATYNITNNFGVSGGWRRLDTHLKLKGDAGEVDFKGLWFGGSIRY
jgi:hypothetical protein